MLKKFFSCLICVTVSNASAECWVVGNFKGYSANEYEKYKYTTDGISGQSFKIIARQHNSSVTPGELGYSGVSEKSVIGYQSHGELVTLETWVISSDSRKAFLTQTRSGSGSLDGTKSFVGDVLSKCNE